MRTSINQSITKALVAELLQGTCYALYKSTSLPFYLYFTVLRLSHLEPFLQWQMSNVSVPIIISCYKAQPYKYMSVKYSHRTMAKNSKTALLLWKFICPITAEMGEIATHRVTQIKIPNQKNSKILAIFRNITMKVVKYGNGRQRIK